MQPEKPLTGGFSLAVCFFYTERFVICVYSKRVACVIKLYLNKSEPTPGQARSELMVKAVVKQGKARKVAGTAHY